MKTLQADLPYYTGFPGNFSPLKNVICILNIIFLFRLYVLQDLLLLSIYIQHTYMYKMKVKSSQAQKLFSIISGHISRQFYPLRNNRTHQSGSITNSETYPEGIMFLVFCSILFQIWDFDSYVILVFFLNKINHKKLILLPL